jgi:transcriptional regulator NrdR family protein
MNRRFLCAFAGLLFATVASAQDARPKVAIKTFENSESFSRSTIVNGLNGILTRNLQMEYSGTNMAVGIGSSRRKRKVNS